jgi:adenylate cyclase
MTIKKILLLVLLSSLFFVKMLVMGQNNTASDIEVLKKKLSSVQGREKANILLEISYQIQAISNDSATRYAEWALKLSKKLNNDTLIGRSYLYIGQTSMIAGKDSLCFSAFTNAALIFKKINDSAKIANIMTAFGQYYYYKGDFENSYKAYQVALIIYGKLKNPKSFENVILALDGISFIYYDQKDFKNSLLYKHRALKIAEAMDNNGNTVANLYSSIAAVYADWNQNKKALEYYHKAIEINKSTGNKSMLAYSMNNIGITYLHLGYLDTAFFYETRAGKIFEEMNDDIGICASNQSIGEIYQKKKQFNIALKYYQKALVSSEKNGEKSRISSLLMSLGEIYYYMNNMVKAIENCNQSLLIAKSIKNTECIYKNYKLLSDIYSGLNNCNSAFLYYKKYVEKKDSIFNTDIHQQIANIQEKYETDQKEKAIKILKQKEEIQKIDLKRQKIVKNSFLIVAILLLVLASFIFYNFRLKKKANRIIAAEKDRSDKLLMNILPEETAEELKREGSARTRHYDLVSVLFTDFKGFTSIAEKMDPEQLVAELDYCFKAYDMIIEQHHVEKIKTIGDSYMCAGGLPAPNTSNPVDVVKCGIEICRFMRDYKQNRMEQNQPFFEVRIGIHTGPVVSGIVGLKKFAYDIWGDTVNTAARMESSGIPGSVNISGDTYQFIKDHFKCSYRGKIEAKNKGLIDMYLVECCIDGKE